MSRSSNVLIVAGLLVVAAALGFLAGHERSKTASNDSLTIANSAVTIHYPSSWRKARPALTLPGLTFAEPLELAPLGNGKSAGMLAGRIADTTTGPLPQRLVAKFSRLPNTEVVSLNDAEAFRYTEVTLGGVNELITLYSVPGSSGDATGIACYAAPAHPEYLRECDQMVASLTLNTTGTNNILTPNPSYAKQLETAIGSIDAVRVKLRAQLARNPARATVAALAQRLADIFESPLSALGSAEPPPVASSAHLNLSLIESLARVRDAYTKLAGAAKERSSAGYATARADVDSAEARLATTLGELHLIGY